MSIILVGEVNVEMRLVATGLPKSVYVEYIGYLPDNQRFVIFRPEEDWDYNQFVCLIGKEKGSFKPTQVRKVTRARDGGATYVDTDLGTFLFPTPFEPDKKPTIDLRDDKGPQPIIVYPRI